MKEPDPEVQALLDEGTGATLPVELVEQGWGQHTMRWARAYGNGRLATPGTEQQPIFDRECVQCGRPITITLHGTWRDHAGREYCVADLVDERISHAHLDRAEYDVLLTSKIAAMRRARRKTSALAGVVCDRSKNSKDCQHVCDHPIGHFGFHECKNCKHLWA